MYKIDFYIAGIQKAGTTNLAYLLGKANNVITHPQLECTFFYDLNEFNKGVEYLNNYYFFDAKNCPKDFYRVIKHSNTFTSIGTFQRVLQCSPNVQFILIFRNPIQRLVSSYLMEKTRSLYPHSLEKAIDIALNNNSSFEHRVFFAFGKYDKWLTDILKVVNEKQLTYFLFEDLYNDIDHHIGQFSQKYHIDIDLTLLKNVPIQNAQKKFKHEWYQKMIIKLRQSKIKNHIKKIIPAKHWVKWTKKIEHFNYIEPETKFKISKDQENILKDAYYQSILNFERMTGLKTNWLQETERKEPYATQ